MEKKMEKKLKPWYCVSQNIMMRSGCTNGDFESIVYPLPRNVWSLDIQLYRLDKWLYLLDSVV